MRHLGRIIAVHSYKGGTGKTLLSVNLAATFAKHGKNVCLFDLDFRAPSLATLLKVGNTDHWLNDYLNGTCEIDKVLVDLSDRVHDKGKLFVGFANPATEAIRDMSAKDRKWEMRALGRLLALKNSILNDKNFDYIVFDTSPGLQYSSINAIVSADLVLVVSGMDISDIKGTQRMIDELYDLFEKKTGLIMNKVFADVLVSKSQRAELAKELMNNANLPLIEMIPCFCDILKTGGTSVFATENPDHPFIKALDHVATSIEKL